MNSDELPILLWESSNPTSYLHLKRLEKFFKILFNRDKLTTKEKSHVLGISTHTSPKGFYDGEFFDEFESLQFVASPTTGNTHFDEEFLIKRNIQVFKLKGREILNEITSSSEHAVYLMLSAFRNSKRISHAVEDGSWRIRENEFRANQIANKKIGIIGYGRIGHNVANCLKALKAEIFINDIKNINSEFTKLELKNMFKLCDAILISCTYDNSTHKLINKELLNLANNLFLINIARGEIIDEIDLLEAINFGNVQRYYSDVISGEQMGCQKNIIWRESKKNKNIKLTPHSAGLSYESENFAVSDIVSQIELFIEKKCL